MRKRLAGERTSLSCGESEPARACLPQGDAANYPPATIDLVARSRSSPRTSILRAVALVVVDAENVRRSRWPNLSREELVDRVRAWAGREGHELLIVFDGEAPEDAPDLVGSRNADDAIVELAAGFDRPWWLVSSDRGLRARLGDAPARIVGGGSFVRAI
jgi:hypothetical protein